MSNKIDITKLPTEVIKKLMIDPVLFARLVFGTWLWSKQREIAWALMKYRFVAVYSATGTGKSHTVAVLAPFFLQTKENIIIPIVSPNFRSCLRTVWRPICEMYAKSRIKLKGEPTSTKWSVSPRGVHYMEVLSARKIEALQGLHSLYMFQIFEEASGIDDMVWDAMEGNATSSSGLYRLVIGNPLKPEGEFYKTMFDPKYYKIRISIFDTPLFTGEINEIPEKYAKVLRKVLPDDEYVRNAEFKYGKDSAFYKAKVLGQFPEESDMGMFNIDDINFAMAKPFSEKEQEYGEVYVTADIGAGTDETVVCAWKGFDCVEMVTMKREDTTASTGLIKKLADKYEADYIIIDSTGLGKGVADRLMELGYGNVYPINFSENAFESDKYADVVTEMFFGLKNALKEKIVKLPNDDILKRQLMSIEYTFDSQGRFKLYDMRKLKKQKGSPDRGVSVALRFCVIGHRVGII